MPPETALHSWSRRGQRLSALLLMLAPTMAWVIFPALGTVLWLPGVVFHGLFVMLLGLIAFVLSIGRRSWCGMLFLVAVCAAGLALWDAQAITERTEYNLDKVQMMLSELTDPLSHLGFSAPRLAPTGWTSTAFLGRGLWLSLGASLLMSLSAVAEAMSFGRRRPWLAILLGVPRCGQCRGAISLDMTFCALCGQRLLDGFTCRSCQAWCAEGHRFCTTCGTGRAD